MPGVDLFRGKGMFVWIASDLFNADPGKYASEAKRLGLTNVGIKIADSTSDYNSENLLISIILALRAVNVFVWGWHYVRGNNPTGEANKAIERVIRLGLDAYVINAEAEYKEPGKATAAATFMTQLRSGLPDTPIGLSSYRYPNLHMELPWKEFLSKCDFNSPQVYWMQAHNPGQQLETSLKQFNELYPKLGIAPVPYIPTGAAFKEAGWQPTAADLDEFDSKAKELQLPGVLWYRWGHAVMLGFDNVIAKHVWTVPQEPPPDDTPPDDTAPPDDTQPPPQEPVMISRIDEYEGSKNAPAGGGWTAWSSPVVPEGEFWEIEHLQTGMTNKLGTPVGLDILSLDGRYRRLHTGAGSFVKQIGVTLKTGERFRIGTSSFPEGQTFLWYFRVRVEKVKEIL